MKLSEAMKQHEAGIPLDDEEQVTIVGGLTMPASWAVKIVEALENQEPNPVVLAMFPEAEPIYDAAGKFTGCYREVEK